MGKNIILTGGMGYIGSHTVVELLKYDNTVTIVDNNCDYQGVQYVRNNLLKIIDQDRVNCLFFKSIDVTDEDALDSLFAKNRFDTCIHFAALKNVEESQQIPLTYYYNNVTGLIGLLACCTRHGCYDFIFSSSCTVYGNNQNLPFLEKSIDELDIRCLTNPYATSKYICEKILSDLCKSDSRMRCIRDKLHIYGRYYDTKDGTCIRDFIHVCDVAKAHVKTLDKIDTFSKGHNHVYNIGTGTGYSVLNLISTMTEMTKKPIPFVFDERRNGDIPIAYADTTKAQNDLEFVTQFSLDDMCRDSYAFKRKEEKID